MDALESERVSCRPFDTTPGKFFLQVVFHGGVSTTAIMSPATEPFDVRRTSIKLIILLVFGTPTPLGMGYRRTYRRNGQGRF